MEYQTSHGQNIATWAQNLPRTRTNETQPLRNQGHQPQRMYSDVTANRSQLDFTPPMQEQRNNNNHHMAFFRDILNQMKESQNVMNTLLTNIIKNNPQAQNTTPYPLDMLIQQQRPPPPIPNSKPLSVKPPPHATISSTNCNLDTPNFLFINIQGLYPAGNPTKVSYLEALTNPETLFIAIAESHLNPDVKNSEIQIYNYNIHRSDRKIRPRGGVAMYVNSKYISEQIVCYSNDICELQIIKIYIKSDLIYAINLYRPPNCPTKDFTDVLNKIVKCDELKECNNKVIITGDFNLPNCHFDSNGSISSSLNNTNNYILEGLMSLLCLHQFVTEPTRLENILDLIMSNDVNFITNLEVSPTIHSDHNLISSEVNINIDPRNISRKEYGMPFSNINIHKSNWIKINEQLSSIDWKSVLSDLDVKSCWMIIQQRLAAALYSYSPPKQIHTLRISREHRERKRLMKKRRKITKKQSNNISPQQLEKLNQQILDIENEIKISHDNENEKEEREAISRIKENNKYIYKYAKRKSVIRSKIGPLETTCNEITNDPYEMANLLQSQYSSVWNRPTSTNTHNASTSDPEKKMEDFSFTREDIIEAIKSLPSAASPGPDGIGSEILKRCQTSISIPLYILWRKSLDEGEIPSILKEANVSPIYKSKGARKNPENYRPISLTSNVIKIFEKIVKKEVISFLEDNKRLNDFQHGFRSKRSCLTELIDYYNYIVKSILENKGNVDVIYLDFSKAFDKVDHHILIQKTKKIGICGKVLKWIKEFLTNRTQTVIVEGVKSKPAVVISGVPQGTVLGPILFLIMINDICKGIQSQIYSFADDTRLLRSIKSSTDSHILQNDLNLIYDFAIKNNLKFNVEKFELIKFGRNAMLKNETSYHNPSNQNIIATSTVKDLGITFNDNLSFTNHINKIVSKCRQLTGLILRTFKTRNTDIMIMLYKSLIRPNIEYCCQLWYPHKNEDLQKLESIQRTFTFCMPELK